jgi:hypothetical protein
MDPSEEDDLLPAECIALQSVFPPGQDSFGTLPIDCVIPHPQVSEQTMVSMEFYGDTMRERLLLTVEMAFPGGYPELAPLVCSNVSVRCGPAAAIGHDLLPILSDNDTLGNFPGDAITVQRLESAWRARLAQLAAKGVDDGGCEVAFQWIEELRTLQDGLVALSTGDKMAEAASVDSESPVGPEKKDDRRSAAEREGDGDASGQQQQQQQQQRVLVSRAADIAVPPLHSEDAAQPDTWAEVAALRDVVAVEPAAVGLGGATNVGTVTVLFGPRKAGYSLTATVECNKTAAEGGDGRLRVSRAELCSLDLPGIDEAFVAEVAGVLSPLLASGQVVKSAEFLRREFPVSDRAAPGMEFDDDDDDDDGSGGSSDDAELLGGDESFFSPSRFAAALGLGDDERSQLRGKVARVFSYGMRNGGAPSELRKGWTRVSALSFNGKGRNLHRLRGTDAELQRRIIRQTGDFDSKFEAVLQQVGSTLRDPTKPDDFGVFCSKGHHRSVAVAELVAAVLRYLGVDATTRHPHLNKR